MKTFIEFITEVWHASLENKYSAGLSHFDVHKNPSKAELHKIVHSSEAKSARGIIHGNDVYVWDAMKAIHHEVDDELKLDVPKKNYISIGKNRYGSEYTGSDDNAQHIFNHPWVKSTLDKHRFFHG